MTAHDGKAMFRFSLREGDAELTIPPDLSVDSRTELIEFLSLVQRVLLHRPAATTSDSVRSDVEPPDVGGAIPQ